MSRPSRQTIVALALFAVIAGCLTYIAAQRLQWRTPALPAIERFDETRREFARLDYAPLAGLQTVRSILNAAEFQDANLATAEAREKLLDTVAAAIDTYYLADTPDVYKAWRMQSSAFRSEEAIDIRAAIADLRAMPGADKLAIADPHTVEDVFDESWKALRAIDDGVNWPVAICTSSSGLRAILTRTSAALPVGSEFAGGLSRTAWYGGVAMGPSRLFAMHLPYDEYLRSTVDPLICECAVVFEFADGTQRPVRFSCYWQPASKTWTLYSVTQSNFRFGRGVRSWML
ncbi:MAG: hypothetical protein ACR2GY_12325 [Phycisphaerales bacterium]